MSPGEITASIRPTKRVPADYEAEAAAMLLHTAGSAQPLVVRLHYWRTWFQLNQRAYGWHDVPLPDSTARLRRLFERYQLPDEVFEQITES